ncbi:putative diaminobutyrate--2-oxoglutarate aminotransferase [Paenibacillus silvae]|uniref:Diaminobutyrate--2-oxoglutarate transaminase n=1 Tax=Paenibacillus silvae TaxID=1325358 RepID=A0ABQ1Z7W7_9BACL|nr:diaminobutyrate--2-oxoglutarate transaminase [Paenibacillus silvae]GGH50371.1 putative diaminobutyrate--2-oxoglutarate aminotransferase [Paenibacillus silvae]
MSLLQNVYNLESEVRSYVRSFPTVFEKAKGYKIFDTNGKEFIDFFAGAGALNYGHNNPLFKKKLMEYIMNDNITHSLDMATVAKDKFMVRFNDVILKPRDMEYRIMFTGPTGTNAVEGALKLVRKVTGRENIISFTNAFHGMSLGSLALNGNFAKRRGGVPLHYTVHMPYDNYFGEALDTLSYLEKYLEDSGSGIEIPAAVILETIQGEGGLNSASIEWLQGIEKLCRKYEILLIVDEIQVGCGRTGSFFSFESAGIRPDIVCLSKSISGYGLPMALNLIKPEIDIWSPGEHNGTFRGNNLAFITATEALSYWVNEDFSREIQDKAKIIHGVLKAITTEFTEVPMTVRGRGMIQGLAFDISGFALRVSAAAFERGLLIETSGSKGEVIKLIPPLIIDEEGLQAGLSILRESIKICIDNLRCEV